MDTYPNDVATLFEKLDLRDSVFIGHSTPHGRCTTLADQINNELLAFVAD